jgi:hypothetical protein
VNWIAGLVERHFALFVDDSLLTTRAYDPVVDAIGLLLVQGGLDRLLYQGRVGRMDSFQKGIVGGFKLLGRQSENSIDLIRPVQFICDNIPVPATQVGDPLGFGQAGFFLFQPLFRLLKFGDVLEYAKLCDQFSGLVEERLADLANDAHRAVDMHRPVVDVEDRLGVGCVLQGLQRPLLVVRMHQPLDVFLVGQVGRLSGPIAENRQILVGQDRLVRPHFPEPVVQLCDPLRLLKPGQRLLLLRLRLQAFGDVREGDDRPDDLAALSHRDGPVLRREAGSVGPPEHLVVDVGALAGLIGTVDSAVLHRIGRSVRVRVVDQVVHVLAEQ